MKHDLYLKSLKREKFLVTTLRYGILLLFLAFWEVAAQTGFIDPFFFSSPSGVCTTLERLFTEENLLMHIGITLVETLLSFLLVILLSLFIATLLWNSSMLSQIIDPYLVILNSLPKSALAPLFIVWLGTGMTTIIVAGISVAIFGSIISIYTSFKQCEPEKVILIKTLGGTKKDVFLKVVLPASLPTLFATAKVNIGLCLVGVIIGEFLAAKQGLGYLIIYGTQVFKLDMVITSILILCAIAYGLYLILSMLLSMYLKKGGTHC